MSGQEKDGSGGAPGSSGQPPPTPGQPPPPLFPRCRAYKLLLDPCLIKGATKLYRFDGVVPDDPTYPPVICRDPRTTLSLSRMWNRQEGLELRIPRFKIDANYVGKPPPLEVSIANLNDNVDKAFLTDLLQKFGRVEEVLIFYHPLTNRHLGIARITFESITAAKACVAKLHNSPLMGNILNVFFDPFAGKAISMYNELIEEKKVEPPPPPPTPAVKKEEKKGDGKEKPETSSRYSNQKGQHGRPHTPPPPPPSQGHQHHIHTPIQNPLQTPIHNPMQTAIHNHMQTPMSINMTPYPPMTPIPPGSVVSSIGSSGPPILYHPPPVHMGTNNGPPIKSQAPVRATDQTNSSRYHQMPVPPPPPLPPPLPPTLQLNQSETSGVGAAGEGSGREERVGRDETPGTTTTHQNNNNHTATSGENEDDDDDAPSPKMDLDTRIKHLLKCSKSTPFGKFLNFTQSESEEEEEEGDARGKFRCGFTIRKRKSLCISRSEIWQSDNSSVEGSPRPPKSRRRSRSPPPSPFLDQSKRAGSWKPVNGVSNSFRMSDLDQVSDDSEIELPRDPEVYKEEDPSSIQLPPGPPPMPPPIPQQNYNIPLPPASFASSVGSFYPQNSNYVQQQMTPYGVYPGGYPMYPQQQQPQWGGQQPPQFHPGMGYSGHPEAMYPLQVPYYDQHGQLQYLQNAPPLPPEKPPLSPASQLKASSQRIRTSVFGNLTTELRVILRRDCEKRLIEATSFKTFEAWFDAQIKHYKEAKEKRDRENKRLAEERMNGKVEMTITTEDLTGLGFRSIPKLPSFKIQKKVVVPPPPPPPVVPVEDVSSRKSVPVETSEQNGDSDQDIRRKRRPVRGLTFSSDSELASSDDELPTIPKAKPKDSKSKEEKTKTEKLPDYDVSADSISEGEYVSPKPSPARVKKETKKKNKRIIEDVEEGEIDEVGIEIENIVKKEKEREAKKIEDFQRALSPLRPSSPARVSMEGPYVHTYDHNYASTAVKEESPPTPPIIPDPPLPPKKIEAVKVVLKPKVVRTPLKPRQPPPPAPPPPERKPRKAVVSFRPREAAEERKLLTDFLSAGVDAEDMSYFKKCFEKMLGDPSTEWVARTHWVDHPPTNVVEQKKKAKRRVHLTGAARTEGFYKLDADEKRRHKLQWAKVTSVEYSAPGTVGAVGVTALAQEKHQGKTQIEKSREARSQQRRLLTALGSEVTSTSDLLKFNQLKFRKKNLCFRRSTIHDWGLFAAEPIAADEMVIEYVGQTIRPYLADVRERKYEKQGIGSSYLFRIDLENIIDATKCGNLSRFINHSCSPNCYAKVISIQGEKKIVIYSKEAIAVNDEITYDYKFPIEEAEKKILCLCGTPQCRGTLN